MIIYKLLLFFSLVIPLNSAWGQSQDLRLSWEDGLFELRQQAITEKNENLATFIQTGQHPGQWIFPKLKEVSSDKVWINLSGLKESLLSYLKENHPSQDAPIKIIFTHTHPLKTIQRFIEDPQKRYEVYSLNVDPKHNRQLTISPSRTDLATLYSVESTLKKFLSQNNFDNVSVVGMVVCPVGLYTYRSLRSRQEKVSLFPQLVNSPDFSSLDYESQTLVEQKLDRDYFDAKVNWTTLVNQEDHNHFLTSTATFKSLQLAYAAHPASVLLQFHRFESHQLVTGLVGLEK